ncbi:hypothetical protein ACP275_05G069100 [Erythranthe tilingii]
MEGKVVIRTAILMIMANLIFAANNNNNNNNAVESIKTTYNECYLKCARGCFSIPVNTGCLIGCQNACSDCKPSCKNQRLSSLASFCNVGCSLAKCSNITDKDQLMSCLGDCSDIDCKV